MQKYSTRQRKAMLDYLIQHKDESVTANQIAAGLEESGVSISAVYRNLASLEEEGKVTKISKGGSRKVYFRYTAAEDCRSHIHLSCRQCGKTYHMNVPATENLVSSVEKDSGFSVDRSLSVLYGVCEGCRNNK
ncbi:MAG: transcriptional repressor [Clostridia bacterium]|nr:transcriptional repressor [Clostridia bacterium]